jgi:predicted permease
MVTTLRIWFLVVLASMLAVTGWAGTQVPLWRLPASLTSHPWFIATLCDAYWAFLAFYLWVWYREPGRAARVLWLAAIVLLGNIAMAAYALAALSRLPADATAAQLLLRSQPLPAWLPLGLIAVAGGLAAASLL